MTEKDIKDKSEQIIEALTDLSLGKEPHLLSNESFRKLGNHPNFQQIKNIYLAYLQTFDGKIDTPEKIKLLFDLRMKINELFD
ncbi:MAG: hypothetical protein Q7U47_04000 [Paludibacter sp.]|nr:hypothetical protein [Paludibacter sp.]